MVDPVEDWRSADSVLLMTLKASFPQLEQVTFWRSAVVLAVLSPDTNCGTRDTMLLMVSVVPSDVCTLSSVSVTQSSLALLLRTRAMYVRRPLSEMGGEKCLLLQASNLADGRVILLDIGNDGGES